MNSSRIQKILIAILVVLILAVFIGRSVMYTVNERELAVVVQFGDPVASRTDPGLYFKMPFIQEVRRLPATKQFWRSNDTSGALVDLPTEDGKKIEVSAWAIWRVTEPRQFVQVVRTVDNAESDHIQPRVRSAIRNAITAHNLSEVVRSTPRTLTYSIQAVEFEEPEAAAEDEDKEAGDADDEQPLPEDQGVKPGEIHEITVGRQKIMEQVEETIRQRLEESGTGEENRGLELVDVGISNISFVPSVREAAFERLKASMEAIAAKYENAGIQRKQEILNQTQAEVEKIEGEGEEQSQIVRGQADAEIIQQYAEAIQKTGDFYNFIRTLEANKEALRGKSRLILTTDSELFRLLKEAGEAETPPGDSPKAVAGPGD